MKKNLKYNDASWYSALIFSFFPENMLVITMVIIKGSSILRKSVNNLKPHGNHKR